MADLPTVFMAPAPKEWTLIALTGRDARDFLHRLTTADTRRMAPGQGMPAFFLNAKGQIQAAFTLWQFAEHEYAFELDASESGAWRKRLLETIDKYHFGEDLTLSEVSASGKLECRWIFSDGPAPAPLSSLQPGRTSAIDDEIRVCHHGSRQYGRAWVTAWGRPARLAQWADLAFEGARALSPGQLEEWRVRSLGPAADRELTTEVNPLEIGLRAGVSEQKGCYPGQEVLEKILALGAPARRLVRIDGRGPAPAPGSAVTNLADPPAEVGTVTSAIARGDGEVTALAIVRKLHAKPGLEVRGAGGFEGEVTEVAPYENAEGPR